MRDPRAYPAPVRAIGSTHSTTGCVTADGGTLVDMTAMNRIIAIGDDTVTAEAGALYIDVADALRERNLQFFVNVEIGNFTLGSAACCGTKEASFVPDEFGQVGSYVVAHAAGDAGRRVRSRSAECHPRSLQLMRSSYGLLGIVYEVTLRVKPLQAHGRQAPHRAPGPAGARATGAGARSTSRHVLRLSLHQPGGHRAARLPSQ